MTDVWCCVEDCVYNFPTRINPTRRVCCRPFVHLNFDGASYGCSSFEKRKETENPKLLDVCFKCKFWVFAGGSCYCNNPSAATDSRDCYVPVLCSEALTTALSDESGTFLCGLGGDVVTCPKVQAIDYERCLRWRAKKR